MVSVVKLRYSQPCYDYLSIRFSLTVEHVGVAVSQTAGHQLKRSSLTSLAVCVTLNISTSSCYLISAPEDHKSEDLEVTLTQVAEYLVLQVDLVLT